MTRHLLILICGLCLSCFVQKTYAQQSITVSGKVINKETKKAKANVDILSSNLRERLGVSADDGSFSLTIPAGTTVVFKYVDMEDFSRTFFKNEKDIVINMFPSSNEMKQVVVTGFKKVTRETMTGASTVISGKDIQDVPVSNITQLLQGKVAGLNVQVNNGMPGARTSMFLRGLSSANVTGSGAGAFMTPTSPLFVVDGVEVDDNANYQYGFDQAGPGISPLSAIPPEDVQSIEVLKDAQATALYGSRGAYGVILITTKRGNSSIPIVQYSGSYFVNTVPKLRDVIGGRNERDIRLNEIMGFDSSYAAAYALINGTNFLSDSLSPYWNNSTNWQSLFYRNTSNQSHNVNISGGNQQFNYKVNMGYYHENGILQNTGLTRYTLNMNTLYQPSLKFKLLATLNSTMIENQKGSGVGLTQQGVAKGSDTTSLLPPPSAYSANNAAVGTFAVRDNNKTGIINSSLDIEWEPIKHLRLSSNDSYSVTSQVSDNYRPAYINGGLGQATSFNSRAYNLYSRNMISYVNTFNEDNTFNLYVFNELQKNLSSADQLLVKGTANDDIEGPLGNNAYSSYGGTTAYADQRSLAFGGSLEYNYKTKYIIDLSVRTDGTSTNGPNSGWSKNPTVGVRWNFQKENWFKNINWLDYGSLRFSWGSNIIPTGSIFDVYGKYTQGAGYNDESSIVNSWGNIPNPDFRATTSTQADWGFEGGFLHGFLDVTYDFYYKTVVNQVMSRNIADINGFSSISTNDLSQADYGHELSLNFRPFSGDHALKWNFSINGSYVRDVLTQLPGGTRQMIIQDQSTENLPVLYRLGRNTFTNLLFNTKGVYAANADVPINPADGKPLRVINNGVVTYLHAGDPIWADLNGDYVIDGADRVAVGDPAPKITGGINSFLQYKNFSLNVNVSYTLLRDIINTTAAHRFQGFADPTSPGVLVPIGQYNYWEKPGDIAKYPNPFDFLNYKAVQPFRYNQTMYMEDGSYFKVNDITLGYNFNRDLTKRWGITSCRVYVTAANVATFSHYSGPDPENVTDLGYDNSNGYPNRRNYTIGFNVQF